MKKNERSVLMSDNWQSTNSVRVLELKRWSLPKVVMREWT